MLLVSCFLAGIVSCAKDSKPAIELAISSTKDGAWTEEAVPLSAEVKWLDGDEGGSLEFEWSSENGEIRLWDDDPSRIWFTVASEGEAVANLKVHVLDDQGRRIAFAQAYKRIAFSARISPDSDFVSALTFIPKSLYSVISGDLSWSSSDEKVAEIDEPTETCSNACSDIWRGGHASTRRQRFRSRGRLVFQRDP